MAYKPQGKYIALKKKKKTCLRTPFLEHNGVQIQKTKKRKNENEREERRKSKKSIKKYFE